MNVRKLYFTLIGAAVMVAMVILMAGCGSDSDDSNAQRTADIWQNPYMSTNPNNNVHCDSYMSDSYAFAGPTSARQTAVAQVEFSFVKDPQTGDDRFGGGDRQ